MVLASERWQAIESERSARSVDEPSGRGTAPLTETKGDDGRSRPSHAERASENYRW
jgi:hypothetical protein